MSFRVKDYFIEWSEVYTILNQEAEPVVEVFVNKWVTIFGVSVELRSDQGRNFESALIQRMYQKLGIRKRMELTQIHVGRLRKSAAP